MYIDLRGDDSRQCTGGMGSMSKPGSVWLRRHGGGKLMMYGLNLVIDEVQKLLALMGHCKVGGSVFGLK